MRAPSLYCGLGLLTCSMLLVQQFLTRVFSIQFNSGLAFLAISTTFLGLGEGSVCRRSPSRSYTKIFPANLSVTMTVLSAGSVGWTQ